LSFRWDAVLPDIKGLPKPEFEEIASMPLYGIEKTVFREAAFDVGYPGVLLISDLTAVFVEDQFGTALRYFQGWRSLIRNADGTYNLPIQYKKTILARLYSNPGRIHTTLKLDGVFPQIPGIGPFSYAISELMKMTVNFSVDIVTIV
jgi:hypothetical protein